MNTDRWVRRLADVIRRKLLALATKRSHCACPKRLTVHLRARMSPPAPKIKPLTRSPSPAQGFFFVRLSQSSISNRILTRRFAGKSQSQGNVCQRNGKKNLQFYSPDNDSLDSSGLSSLHPASSLWLRPAALCSFAFFCVLLRPHPVRIFSPPRRRSCSPQPARRNRTAEIRPKKILNNCSCSPVKTWYSGVCEAPARLFFEGAPRRGRLVRRSLGEGGSRTGPRP